MYFSNGGKTRDFITVQQPRVSLFVIDLIGTRIESGISAYQTKTDKGQSLHPTEVLHI